ncbi:hypothetical protein Mgra_00008608 [Meloidogyne graminicola]|uniref:Uncharacterized protein n=1 Tax=Meloidogyne graminicola TaxID=189291 RepID=A0A8S9ZF92_9BILA|nr:hypothetical protein Mgra_00008608 [Meloidogyne graminicola]
MKKIILFSILLSNFVYFNKSNEIDDKIVKKNIQCEITKLVDLVKLNKLNDKLNLLQEKMEKCEDGENFEVMGNMKELSKQGKKIMKQIELTNLNNLQLENVFNAKNPHSVQQIALKMYLNFVESKSPIELILSLKNAKILDFDELFKQGPNKILNILNELIKEISQEKGLNLFGNISFVFSLWKTLAFNSEWNKIVKHLDCCCCKNENNSMAKVVNKSPFPLRRFKRYWPNNRRFLCLCAEDRITCSCKCFVGIIIAELIVIAILVGFLWAFIVKWQISKVSRIITKIFNFRDII